MDRLKDIDSRNDIELLVNTFYAEIRKDDLLKDIFNNAINGQWPKHLEKMYRFWETVLLDKHTYLGSPFFPHAKLDLNSQHFKRWLLLFNSTIDKYFVGEVADEAKWRAIRMAELFLSKIKYIQNNSSKNIF